MSGVVKVGGADKIAAVARALRHLGTDRTILTEMAKRIRRLSPGVRRAIKASARQNLPKRGGLNRWVAAASIRVSVTRSPTRAGISITVGRNSAHGRSDIKRLDAGITRAPLWGNRKHWYPHTVTPGFATRVVDTDVFAAFRAGAEESIDEAVRQVLDVL